MPAIHLSVLAFRHVRAVSREQFCEIANQSLYTSHNITNFIHLWFCEKPDKKLAVSSSLTFRENTDHLGRRAKCTMRKMIGETVYKMPSIYFSFRQQFSHSHQFDDKCIAGLKLDIHFSYFVFHECFRETDHEIRNTHYTHFAFHVNFMFY